MKILLKLCSQFECEIFSFTSLSHLVQLESRAEVLKSCLYWILGDLRNESVMRSTYKKSFLFAYIMPSHFGASEVLVSFELLIFLIQIY